MPRLTSQTLSPAHQRLAVLSLALGSFASVTTEFLPVGILPDISKTFAVTSGTAGLTMTVPGIMAALSAPGVMLFSGRTDRRKIVLWLSLILLAGCLVATIAPTFAIMLLSRALVGISLGAFWAMGLAVAVELVAKEKAHKAAAAVFGGVTAAMILGVPMGFVAQILARDSRSESRLVTGSDEQAEAHALPNDELVHLQRGAEEAWITDGVV